MRGGLGLREGERLVDDGSVGLDRMLDTIPLRW
jgi:hypothetical protein